MKEKPILFSAPMVRAILGGTKTQTRRLVKFRKPGALIYNPSLSRVDGPNAVCRSQYLHVPFRHRDEPDDGCLERLFPPWEVGGRLWVKETCGELAGDIFYRADGDEFLDSDGGIFSGPWKPSIFMRRIYSRINLEIESVRVERLNEISDADAVAEGVVTWWLTTNSEASNFAGNLSHVQAYQRLWESINGAGSWVTNPWVWVIEFKKV